MTYGYPALAFAGPTPAHVPRLSAGQLTPTAWLWYPSGNGHPHHWTLRLSSASGTVYHRRLHDYGYPTIMHAGKVYALDQPLPTLPMYLPDDTPVSAYVERPKP